MIQTARRVLLALLLFGLIGSAIELFLLKHTDGVLQLIPLGLIGLALLVLLWHGASSSRAGLVAFQLTMVLLVLSGIAGTLLHYRGNVEWELERMPGARGWELFRQAIKGATPSLAPGLMLHLGLVGLVASYLRPRTQNRLEQ